jgi:DNA primase
MDVIQLAQAGFGESVAALGTAITGTHVSALLRITDHVVFAFDGDAAGRKAARRALEAALPVIADTKRASFLLLPEGEDPDSLIKARGKQGFESELAHALPLSQFFVRALAGGSSLATAEDRAALVAAAKPLLLSMAPGAMRAQLLRELAEAARMPADEVAAMFGLRRAAPARPSAMARRTPHVEVDDLKRRVLQQLLVHPQLAAEFVDAVAAEHGGDDQVDREIVEVSNVALAQSPGAASVLNHGALMELLSESEHANGYRALAAQEMELETDVETARTILAEAFGKLRLRRLERVRTERLGAYQQDQSPAALEAYRTADQEYLRARAETLDSPNP